MHINTYAMHMSVTSRIPYPVSRIHLYSSGIRCRSRIFFPPPISVPCPLSHLRSLFAAMQHDRNLMSGSSDGMETRLHIHRETVREGNYHPISAGPITSVEQLCRERGMVSHDPFDPPSYLGHRGYRSLSHQPSPRNEELSEVCLLRIFRL